MDAEGHALMTLIANSGAEWCINGVYTVYTLYSVNLGLQRFVHVYSRA